MAPCRLVFLTSSVRLLNVAKIFSSADRRARERPLVKALLDLIPEHERVLLIEDTAELPLKRPNSVRFTAREGVFIRDLLKASLRHRPDRIVVGEVRDGAAYDLLQALNTGHAGSISTLHASSATNALNRLARLALQADTGLPFGSIQSEIGDAIHYVAHIERRGSRREVTELIRVTGFHSDSEAWQFVSVSGAATCK